MSMRILAIIALIGGIGILFFLIPVIISAFNSSDQQILDRVNNMREVQVFQERFGPASPRISRDDGCCTTAVYYVVNGTLVSYPVYDTEKQYPSVRSMLLNINISPWETKMSLVCSGAGLRPTNLGADIQTIRTTDCLEKP
ncbi:hypothetical protein NTE_00803 [Candidatus Nitrososphaera evergladensis SR1]|jgi:hypothetical protein|uniref:Uncharacterized protein n=1 Tax=Candidatus Nitrososphaera evergladensis SR1 TaxID=1459636 RepID=A0A075MN14_9ARCH|nr:hypothetical protein NTE_00803 [Candidatus Nitrososphaera evergladensis SR1]